MGRSRTGQQGTPRRSPASEQTREQALRTELRIANDNLGLIQRQLESYAAATAGEDIPFREAAPALADLERQLISDPGWRLFTVLADREFSPEGMAQLRAVCRLMAIANPLIKRGLGLRSVYVWGQGVQVTARANGRQEGEQDVNTVLDAALDDPGNLRSISGPQAHDEMEHALSTEGEVFVALFTRPASGWVSARTIPADEINDIITNPDDKSEPWYYKRLWSRTSYDTNGLPVYEQQELLYPDVDYKPRRRPGTFAGMRVSWDTQMLHLAVNRPQGWLRGIPDAYASVNWARAYKEFLEQWAGLMRSLARFAWKLSAEGKQREQAKRAMAAAVNAPSRNATGVANDVGGVAVTPFGGDIEAIPKTGATIDAESGRPLAMMVAAGLGVPVTMLLADPGQTGARATAETLDWPTELTMMQRRQLWTGFFQRIARHIITEAVRAPKGKLKGKISRDSVTDREVVELAGDTDTTVDVDWPPLDEVDPKDVIDAVIAANGAGVLPPELVLRTLLKALGVRDPESIIEKLTDDDGNFLWPTTGAPAPGQDAAAAARDGADPAGTGAPGSMTPDEDGGPVEVEGVSEAAAARQADADFGLFGSTATGNDSDDQDQDEPATTTTPSAAAGPAPADAYDPEFFRL